ncbi:hypothetical protein DFH06DRAFT_1135337 [Mycena polygramma]|nr:hypothetical protein DFH06DRAFT_1135337 [Mycena polygramma]
MSGTENSFGTTVSSGIQDLSAILSLLGTEQCETHVGSALRGDERGGYLYAAITPISIFGSLGPAKAALSIMFVNIPFVGSKTLQNMGFEVKGAAAAITMLDGKRYEAENCVLNILDRHHIHSAQYVRVQRPGTLDQPFTNRLPQSWNLQLLAASLLVACLGVMPYLHFSVLHHTSFLALTIFFPFCRVSGGLLCVFPGQLLLQYRIEMIVSMLWDESCASEVCLSSLQDFLNKPVAGKPETARFMESLKLVLRLDSKSSPSEVATVLTSYVTNTWTWFALMSALLCGLLMTIVGYIGCFTIVQNSSTPSDTYIWLALETTLALIRLLIWALNPPWDDLDGLWLTVDCEKTTPLHETLGIDGNPGGDEILGTDDRLPQIFKIVPETRFWEALTLYSGPVNINEMERVYGFRHSYSLVVHKTGPETLCIILEEETTAREPWTIMCMMNEDHDLEFHVADIVSMRGRAVKVQLLGADHPLMKAPSEFRTNVFKHYKFILSKKSSEPAPIKVSWPLSEWLVMRLGIPNIGLHDPEQGPSNVPATLENAWKLLKTGIELTLSGGVVTYDQFSTYLQIIPRHSASRDLHQQLSKCLDIYTQRIHKGREKSGKDDIDTVKNTNFHFC